MAAIIVMAVLYFENHT
ncbi:hypothetical protein IHK47_RS11750 [Escherichia coli]